MSEKDEENNKSTGKGDAIVIEIIQKKRKHRENTEKEDCKLISNYQKQINIGNGSQDVIAFPVVSATIADVHNIVAAHPVGVLPAVFLNLPADVAANTAVLAAITANVAANRAALGALAGVPAALGALAGVPLALAALTDNVALANNRGCNDLDHPLIPRAAPPAANAQQPAGFPPTVRVMMALPGVVVDSFLQYWNLPVIGTLVSRKRRLGTFLGIPARFM